MKTVRRVLEIFHLRSIRRGLRWFFEGVKLKAEIRGRLIASVLASKMYKYNEKSIEVVGC